MTAKIGLSLSGGGYRATLFNLGALWRLNELGILSNLSIVSSVSGGSITSAHLALEWKNLNFNAVGVATNFDTLISQPIEKFCSIGIDYKIGLKGFFNPFSDTATEMAKEYEGLFGQKTLSDLPNDKDGKGPKFVILSTNYQTGSAFRFMHDGFADYQLGEYEAPEVTVATAVAASSAFPPIFSPLTLRLKPEHWTNAKTQDLPITVWKRPTLVDGGVYDNLGLQAIRDHVDVALVSDAGKPFAKKGKQRRNWFSQLGRVRDIGMNQALAQRKSELIAAFRRKAIQGTYWGITTDIDKYNTNPSFYKMNEQAQSQSRIRTRLNAFTRLEQNGLVNWGYALSDAAIRTYTPDIIRCNSAPNWPKEPNCL